MRCSGQENGDRQMEVKEKGEGVEENAVKSNERKQAAALREGKK